MVPTLTWGLSRSNLAFATLVSLLLLNRLRSSNDEPTQDISFRLPLLLGESGGFFLVAADLTGDVGRDFLVAIELHRVRGPALGVGPQVGRVTEHLGQRHVAGDDLRVAALLHPVDLTAAAVEIADHVAH